MGGKKQKSIIPGPTLILDPRVYLHPKLRNCKYPDNPGKIQVSKDFSYKLRTLILVFYSCNIIMIQFTTNILSRDIWGTLKWAKFSLLPRGYTALLFGKVAVFMKSSKRGETTLLWKPFWRQFVLMHGAKSMKNESFWSFFIWEPAKKSLLLPSQRSNMWKIAFIHKFNTYLYLFLLSEYIFQQSVWTIKSSERP